MAIQVEPRERIIVALDVDTLDQVKSHVESLSSHVGCFKVGLELINTVGGPQVVECIHSMEGEVFYDIKEKDIPTTMRRTAAGISRLGVRMLNVHATAGIDGMMAALEGARPEGTEDEGWGDERPPHVPYQALVIGVTILTSMDEVDAYLIYGAPIKAKVLQLARDVKLAGLDGVICSPQELEFLKKRKELDGLIYVTPGVRPEWAVAGDQKRITTPGDAIKAGADFLVIGRPILQPPAEIGGPVDAAQKVAEEIAAALQELEAA